MRLKLSSSLERRVLVKNKHCCCICQNDGYGKEVLVHHINGNNSNNVESNLAILCLVHASQADAGLKKGKLGSGKKLKPDAIKLYKKLWQRKVEHEQQHRREFLDLKERKQFEILFKFEIHKTMYLILSLKDTDKRVLESFDYLDQFIAEDFTSGIDIRTILVDAFSNISFHNFHSIEIIPCRLAKSIGELLSYYSGVTNPTSSKEKYIFNECLIILEDLGEDAAKYEGGTSVLKAVCQAMFDFAEQISWQDLVTEKKILISTFEKIHKACSEYKHGDVGYKKEIMNRQATVQEFLNNTKIVYEEGRIEALRFKKFLKNYKNGRK